MLPPTVEASRQICSVSSGSAASAHAAAWSDAMADASVVSTRQGQSGTDKAASLNSSKTDDVPKIRSTGHDASAPDELYTLANMAHRKFLLEANEQGAVASPVIAQHGQKDRKKEDQQTANATADMLSGFIAPKNLSAANVGDGQHEAVGKPGDTHDSTAEIEPNAAVAGASSNTSKRAASDMATGVTESSLNKNVASPETSESIKVYAVPGVFQTHQDAGLVADSVPGSVEKGQASVAAGQSAKQNSTKIMKDLLARSAAQQVINTPLAGQAKVSETTKQMYASSVISVVPLHSALTSPQIYDLRATTEITLTEAGTQPSGDVDAGSASALAATVTAMQQAGQTHTVLRLDPPGLGNMSIHLSLGLQGQVNVLFVPDTSAGAQALQSGLGGFGQSMVQAGIALGQAQVGGQFGQSAHGFGQNARQWQGGGTSTSQTTTSSAGSAESGGVSAYA